MNEARGALLTEILDQDSPGGVSQTEIMVFTGIGGLLSWLSRTAANVAVIVKEVMHASR